MCMIGSFTYSLFVYVVKNERFSMIWSFSKGENFTFNGLKLPLTCSMLALHLLHHTIKR